MGTYSNLLQKEGYGELAGTMLPTSLNLTFLCEYVSGETNVSSESLEVRWVSCDQAREMVTTPQVRRRLIDMLEYNGVPVFSAFRMSNGKFEEVQDIRL